MTANNPLHCFHANQSFRRHQIIAIVLKLPFASVSKTFPRHELPYPQTP